MKQLTLLIIIASGIIGCKNKCATCKSTTTTTVTGSNVSVPPYTFIHEECGANLRAVNGKTKRSSSKGIKSTTTTYCY